MPCALHPTENLNLATIAGGDSIPEQLAIVRRCDDSHGILFSLIRRRREEGPWVAVFWRGARRYRIKLCQNGRWRAGRARGIMRE